MFSFSQWPSIAEPLLLKTGHSFGRPQQLARCILALSTHYQNPSSTTPWANPDFQAAYFSYFFPLNVLRLREVFNIALTHGQLVDEDTIIDYGAGPAVAAFALPDSVEADYYAIESCPEPADHFRQLRQRPERRIRFVDSCQQVLGASSKNTSSKNTKAITALFSYSLNELGRLPEEVLDFGSIIIVEPSTQVAGRELLKVREQLIQSGFTIHAPCLHQKDCPLLTRSKRDWCHHRIDVESAAWMQSIEEHMPLKNPDLTFSYLIASRAKPHEYLKPTFRITGDLRREKGKSKIMACRNDEREFLSWLKKEKHQPSLLRGDIVELTDEIESYNQKGDEIRPEKNYRKLLSLRF